MHTAPRRPLRLGLTQRLHVQSVCSVKRVSVTVSVKVCMCRVMSVCRVSALSQLKENKNSMIRECSYASSMQRESEC